VRWGRQVVGAPTLTFAYSGHGHPDALDAVAARGTV